MVTGFDLGLYALLLIGNVHLILHQLALLFYRQRTHGDKNNKDKESSHLLIIYLELTSDPARAVAEEINRNLGAPTRRLPECAIECGKLGLRQAPFIIIRLTAAIYFASQCICWAGLTSVETSKGSWLMQWIFWSLKTIFVNLNQIILSFSELNFLYCLEKLFRSADFCRLKKC